MTIAERFLSKVRTASEDDCWIWNACRNAGGYGRFNYLGKIINAQRAAYLIFKGPVPDDLGVLHKCDNPPCVNPRHLEIGTHKKNMIDAWKRGLQPRDRNNVKTTKKERAEIREATDSLRELAAHYGVTTATINNIIFGSYMTYAEED